jgi:hypothetical protein
VCALIVDEWHKDSTAAQNLRASSSHSVGGTIDLNEISADSHSLFVAFESIHLLQLPRQAGQRM